MFFRVYSLLKYSNKIIFFCSLVTLIFINTHRGFPFIFCYCHISFQFLMLRLSLNNSYESESTVHAFCIAFRYFIHPNTLHIHWTQIFVKTRIKGIWQALYCSKKILDHFRTFPCVILLYHCTCTNLKL